jgi:hypothetical protein
MAMTGKITGTDKGQKHQRVYFTLTFTGSYPGTPGETANFSTFTQTVGYDNPVSSQLPKIVVITGIAGYSYSYIAGTTNQNGTVAVFQGGASASNPQAQIGTTTYPSGVTGDTVSGYADFAFGI